MQSKLYLQLICLWAIFSVLLVSSNAKEVQFKSFLPTIEEIKEYNQILQQTQLLQDYSSSLSMDLCSYCISSYCNPKHLPNWDCGSTCSSHPEIKEVEVMYNSTGQALGYVAYNTKYSSIQVVFRGTLPWSITDWIDDIDFIPTAYPLCNNYCQVHRGFYHTFLNLKSQFETFFQTKVKKYPGAGILVTGHSLGGALAHLCAAQLASSGIKFKLYTYGSPRVGDPSWMTWFDSVYQDTYYRVTNGKDPVPHLPPMDFGFRHCPREVFYQGSNYKICNESGEDPTCSDQYLLPDSVPDHLHYMGYDFTSLILKCQV